MKTSNRILFISLLAAAASVLILIIVSRLLFNNLADFSADDYQYSGSMNSGSLDITGFDSVKVSGNWEIIINNGQEYSIETKIPENAENTYSIRKSGNTLIAEQDRNARINKAYILKMTMPEIKKVETTGGTKVEISGFDSDRLFIETSGGAQVKGSGSRFEDLNISSSGAVDLDFRNTPTVNADIDVAGAGNLILNMDGGKLSGSASGVINVEYYGKADNKLEVSGLCSISQK